MLTLGGTKSTGSITAIAGSLLVDGETFTMPDGNGGTRIGEFDLSGDGVIAGNFAVSAVSGDTDIQVRDKIVTAINGESDILITAAAGAGAVVDLTADNNGTVANGVITDTVADGGFTHTDMTGGLTVDLDQLVSDAVDQVNSAEGIT